MARDRVYAYVTSETCRRIDAQRPGGSIGRNEVPVSKHGDYRAWKHGKMETLRRIACSTFSAYERECAEAVADLLYWEASK